MIDKKKIQKYIVDIKDYPKPGIMFRDITPLFAHHDIIEEIINDLAEFASKLKIDVVVGAESRGFLLGVPLAQKIKKPFVLVRKPNKLPRDVYSVEYDLEYGTSEMQMHVDAIKRGQRVLIVDDLLATGGTVRAIEQLIQMAQGIVAGSAYLIELKDLHGRDKLTGDVYSILQY